MLLDGVAFVMLIIVFVCVFVLGMVFEHLVENK